MDIAPGTFTLGARPDPVSPTVTFEENPDAFHTPLAEFSLINEERLADYQEINREMAPNELPLSAFNLGGHVLKGGAVLTVARTGTGRLVGFIEDVYWVETLDNPCKSGYHTGAMIGRLADPEALAVTGILKIAERVGKTLEGLYAFGLTDHMIYERRSRLFKAADKEIVDRRTDQENPELDAWVAKWFINNLLADYQNTGVRADMIWRARKLLFELTGISADEIQCFLHKHVMNWCPDQEPVLDESRQFTDFADEFGIDPAVEQVFRKLQG